MRALTVLHCLNALTNNTCRAALEIGGQFVELVSPIYSIADKPKETGLGRVLAIQTPSMVVTVISCLHLALRHCGYIV